MDSVVLLLGSWSTDCARTEYVWKSQDISLANKSEPGCHDVYKDYSHFQVSSDCVCIFIVIIFASVWEIKLQ